MDVQFFGANCLSVTYKGTRIIIDDNLAELGAKGITKADDIALFTNEHEVNDVARLVFDSPGEYEVADVSIIGIPARAHMDEDGKKTATIFKLIAGDQSILVTGHVYPDLSENQLETIGMVDLLIVPVGGSGYTTDAVGALKLIKSIEPKLVVPVHFADKDLKYPVPQVDKASALKELGMEPKDTVSKLKLKGSELSDLTQLIILEKS